LLKEKKELLVAGCWLLVIEFLVYLCNCFAIISLVLYFMIKSYNDLEIYQEAFELAKRIHIASLTLPPFELYEQGSQIRRSSKSIKDQIAEGYGRRRYKLDFLKFLVYSQASCDETISQLDMIINLYPELNVFVSLLPEYIVLGKKINRFIQFVETNWKT
jgi:four helix bundle protein